jgi:hypothetical protein
MAVTLEGIDFVWIFSADSELPIGLQFVPMQFDPCLNQAQLFAGQLTGKNFGLLNPDRRLELSIFGVDVRQIVMLAVEQVHANDDAINIEIIGMGYLK